MDLSDFIPLFATFLAGMIPVYLNWRRDKQNEKKQARDDLKDDYTRMRTERDDLLVKLSKCEDDKNEKIEKLEAQVETLISRLRERDATINKLVGCNSGLPEDNPNI